MSGLETLPPDQRAVLQLILRQGRGYAELAGMLKIDERAVRERAHAGLAALGGPAGGELAPDDRARIADYLLGQQDDAERIVTLAQLGDAPDAADWARRLHAQLAGLAARPIPEVPAAVGATVAAANGVTAAPGNGVVAAPANGAAASRVGASAGERRPPAASAAAPRPSRLGGALLLGGIAAVLVAILLVVLLSGGSAKHVATTGTSAATTPTQTSTQAQSQPSAQPLAQVNFQPAIPGGHAIGIGVVARTGGQLVLAVQAQHLAANGTKDGYALWLQGPPGPKLLGFVPQRVGSKGTFAVSAPLPSDAKRWTSVIVTRESTANPSVKPTQPGTVVLNGALTLP